MTVQAGSLDPVSDVGFDFFENGGLAESMKLVLVRLALRKNDIKIAVKYGKVY